MTPDSFPSVPLPNQASARFVAVYATLALVLVGSLGAFIVFGLKPSFSSSPKWSPWKPASGSLPAMGKEIADHVGPSYRFAKGSQLVAVVASAPAVTAGTQNVSIVAVSAVSTGGDEQGVTSLEPGATEMYTLCGLGVHCAIATGAPTKARGQLVRREGLEVALYTFKYVHAVESVIVYLPPALATSSPYVLYFTRESLSGRLDLPLDQTLKLATPPRAGQADPKEAGLLDALTLPHLFAAGLIELPVGGALLTLTPYTA